MIPRPFRWLPEHDFPADPWRLIERGHHDDLVGRTESLFALSNGYLGIRGAYDEARPAHQRGTFINGFHETWPIVYAEDAYGFARNGQTIINAPDGTITRLYVDDEPIFLSPAADLVQADRVLDMRNGVLERELVWRTPLGKLVRVRSQRLVSLRHRHLAAISWEVEVENAEATLVVTSELFNHQDARSVDEPTVFDPRRAKGMQHRVLDPALQEVADGRIVMGYVAHNSGMTLACGVDHAVSTECDYQTTSETSEDLGKVVFTIHAKPGIPFRMTKLLAYHNSRSVPPATSPRESTEPSTGAETPDSNAWLSGSVSTWTRSGTVPMSASVGPTVSSRRSAGTCSNSSSTRPAPRAPASRRRDSAPRPMKGTTSGTWRYSLFRFCSTPSPTSPATF